MYSSHPIFTGAAMGLSIAVLDLVLMPNLGKGLGQALRFFIEGSACFFIYKMFSREQGDTYTFDGSFIQSSTLVAISIWLMDVVMRPVITNDMRIIKFFVQGIIVYYVLAMTNSA